MGKKYKIKSNQINSPLFLISFENAARNVSRPRTPINDFVFFSVLMEGDQ